MPSTHKKQLFQTRISLLITLFSFCFALGLFLFPQSGLAAQVTLAWDANTEGDLAGYRLFYHGEGETYNYDAPGWQGTDTTCAVSGLTENTTYYFVARAYDTSNNESADSQEISYTTY
ncbi:MAG: fibronectin type III domain-containing protein, partial [Deltaproteobacteria bacterium]|nr:fibronectin type III domain-containing protein [Deltaproteobacteria bacterium]